MCWASRSCAARDRSGFVVNALLVPYLLSAIRMVEAGVATVEDIDTAVVAGLSHPMGPLRLSDLVGLDTLKLIADTMFEEFKEPLTRRRRCCCAWSRRVSWARSRVRASTRTEPSARVHGSVGPCTRVARMTCVPVETIARGCRDMSQVSPTLSPFYEESQSIYDVLATILRRCSSARPWATPCAVLRARRHDAGRGAERQVRSGTGQARASSRG